MSKCYLKILHSRFLQNDIKEFYRIIKLHICPATEYILQNCVFDSPGIIGTKPDTIKYDKPTEKHEIKVIVTKRMIQPLLQDWEFDSIKYYEIKHEKPSFSEGILNSGNDVAVLQNRKITRTTLPIMSSRSSPKFSSPSTPTNSNKNISFSYISNPSSPNHKNDYLSDSITLSDVFNARRESIVSISDIDSINI